MTDRIARARHAATLPIAYKLGAGGRHPGQVGKYPEATSPADNQGRCDCSGFLCWSLGLDRYQPTWPELVRFNGGWLSTDGILAMATARSGAGKHGFSTIKTPEPGCLVVYGHRLVAGEKRIGHCALIVSTPIEWTGSVGSWETMRVIHCSVSNGKRTPGRAIAETSGAIFRRRGTLVRYDVAP